MTIFLWTAVVMVAQELKNRDLSESSENRHPFVPQTLRIMQIIREPSLLHECGLHPEQHQRDDQND
jgi:hypothetical protein